jgi:dienelactone hydrolase
MANHLPRTVLTRSLSSALIVALVACSSSYSNTTPGGGTDDGGSPSGNVDGGGSGGGDGGAITPGTDGGTGSTDGGSTVGGNYDVDGPFKVTKKTEQASNGKGSFGVTVFVPSGAGPFPVVVLSSGLQQPAAGYAPYAQRLASWGIATITRDDPGFTSQTPSVQADVEGLVQSWLPTADGGIYDTKKVGLAGHSRGGLVSLLAAENGLLGKNKGLFLLDPVDNSGSSAKPKIASLGVPLAMIGETTDSAGAGMPCAPAADNYASFYALASSPAVAITAVDADHVMFQDPNNCSFCGLCTKGKADPAKVLAISQRLMTTFFAKVLLGDSKVDATLNTTADVTAGTVTVESK